MKCINCPLNDYRKAGVSYCMLPRCLYEEQREQNCDDGKIHPPANSNKDVSMNFTYLHRGANYAEKYWKKIITSVRYAKVKVSTHGPIMCIMLTMCGCIQS